MLADNIKIVDFKSAYFASHLIICFHHNMIQDLIEVLHIDQSLRPSTSIIIFTNSIKFKLFWRQSVFFSFSIPLESGIIYPVRWKLMQYCNLFKKNFGNRFF